MILDSLLFGYVASTTVAIISLVLAAASAAAGTYASISSAKAQQDAAKFNKRVSENNALQAQQQAKFQADRVRKRNVLIAGKQRAAYLKSGFDLSGSAEDVMMDSAIEGQLDIAAAQYAGNSESVSQLSRAKLYAMQGNAAGRAGTISAVGTILGGASSVGKSYQNYVNTTAKDPEF